MTTRNLDALFTPNAVALIGASNEAGSVGAVLARNLLESGFAGPVLAVNPHEAAIRSTLSYKRLADLPMIPDLALLRDTPAPLPPWRRNLYRTLALNWQGNARQHRRPVRRNRASRRSKLRNAPATARKTICSTFPRSCGAKPTESASPVAALGKGRDVGEFVAPTTN